MREDIAGPVASSRPPAARRERALLHVPCNLCGHEVTHGVHDVSRLVRCIHCQLVFVNPRPAFEDLAHRYEESYFRCDEPTFGGYEDYEADREDIVRTLRRRLARLRPLLSTERPRLLDVGCATGVFLEVAREEGWTGEGMDISEFALARTRAKGFTAHRGTLPGIDLPEAQYDVVTLWDVIEHVPDPAATLGACRRLLKPGGLLAISTPDAGSLLARVLRGRWLGFRSIDEHLYFFTRSTMSAMLVKEGFEVKRFYAVGKYLTLPRLIERLRFYTRVGALLLRAVDRFVPRLSVYVNSLDTMYVLAARPSSASSDAE